MVSVGYLAGFVDGEGTLTVAKRRHPGRSIEYSARVSISNTNQEILGAIQETWGGTLATQFPDNPTWKPSHDLIWTNAAAVALLTQIGPHLRIKSSHAAALLGFQVHIRRCQRTRDARGRLLPLAELQLEIREIFYRRLKRLNARGARPPPFRPEAGSDLRAGNCAVVSRDYLAGFIDAEGCLMVAKVRDRSTNRPRYSGRISVSNTDRRVLDEIRQTYGGILVNQPRPKASWKHLYQVVWTGGMVGELLSKVGPYVRIKQPQVIVMTELLVHMKDTPRRDMRTGYGRLPDHVLEFREALYSRMKELNAKGMFPRPTRPIGPAEALDSHNPKNPEPFQGP